MRLFCGQISTPQIPSTEYWERVTSKKTTRKGKMLYARINAQKQSEF